MRVFFIVIIIIIKNVFLSVFFKNETNYEFCDYFIIKLLVTGSFIDDMLLNNISFIFLLFNYEFICR